jgi:hypothetical protein
MLAASIGFPRLWPKTKPGKRPPVLQVHRGAQQGYGRQHLGPRGNGFLTARVQQLVIVNVEQHPVHAVPVGHDDKTVHTLLLPRQYVHEIVLPRPVHGRRVFVVHGHPLSGLGGQVMDPVFVTDLRAAVRTQSPGVQKKYNLKIIFPVHQHHKPKPSRNK